jgi:hypothetical protein
MLLAFLGLMDLFSYIFLGQFFREKRLRTGQAGCNSDEVLISIRPLASSKPSA